MKSVLLTLFLLAASLTTQAIDIAISVTAPSCNGQSNGTATALATGGTGDYTYSWSNGQSSATATGLGAGTYTVTVTDQSGAAATAEAIVPEGPAFSVNLVVNKAECPGVDNGDATAVVNGGTGNYAYQWSNGAPGVSQINGLTAGTTISVTVTDLTSGCTATASAFINAHAQLLTQVSATDVQCGGTNTGSATVNPLNGVAPYQYLWGTGAQTQSINNLTVGAYPVTIADARGCTAVNVANIGQASSLNAAFSVTNISCDSADAHITITSQSTSAAVITGYQWAITHNGNTQSFSGNPVIVIDLPVNSLATISLTVTDAQGCADTHSEPFTVGSLPQIVWSLTDEAGACDAGPLPVTVNGSSSWQYQWTPTDGLTFINGDPRNVLISNPATDTPYQVVANNRGCTDTLSVLVLHVNAFSVDLGGAAFTTCDATQQLTATLTAPSNHVSSVIWQNAAQQTVGTGPTLTVPATPDLTTYTVVASTTYGCTASASAVVVGQGVDIAAQILTSVSACGPEGVQGTAVNLDPTDQVTWQWSVTPSGVQVSNPLIPNPVMTGAPGTYTAQVIVTNQNMCSDTLSAPFTLTEAESLEGLVSADVCNGLLVSFSNNSTATGVWTFGDNTTSTDPNPAHTYGVAGAYTATFTPNAGCYLPLTLPLNVLAQPAVVAAINTNLQDCLGAATFQFTDASQHSANIGSWQWTFTPGNQVSNQQNPVVQFDQEGTVTAQLIVTDINNCADTSAIASLQANIVNEEIPASTGICPGGSVALNALNNGSYQYQWTAVPPDPSLDTGSPNPVVSPSQPTVYSVSITNGNCTVTQQAALSIFESANVVAMGDTVVCDPQSVLVTASGNNASNFEWSKNKWFSVVFAVGPVVNIPATTDGMNYVRATTSNGCPGLDSVMVLLGATDVAPAQTNYYVCNGVAADLEIVNNAADQQLTYQWSNGLPATGTPSVAPVTATTYAVTVTNEYQCADTLSFSVTPQTLQLNINVSGKTTICPGESTTLNASVTGGSAYTYDWTPAGTLDNSEIASPVATPVETTEYVVTATDLLSGCTISGNTLITMLVPQCADPFIFVPKAFSPNGDDANDFFRVRGVNMTELYFVVWDRWGEKIYETNEVDHKGWDGTFKGVVSTPDAYAWYARVRCADGEYWEKKGNVTLLR